MLTSSLVLVPLMIWDRTDLLGLVVLSNLLFFHQMVASLIAQRLLLLGFDLFSKRSPSFALPNRCLFYNFQVRLSTLKLLQLHNRHRLAECVTILNLISLDGRVIGDKWPVTGQAGQKLGDFFLLLFFFFQKKVTLLLKAINCLLFQDTLSCTQRE